MSAPRSRRLRRKPHPKPLAETPPYPLLQVKGRIAAASRFHPWAEEADTACWLTSDLWIAPRAAPGSQRQG